MENSPVKRGPSSYDGGGNPVNAAPCPHFGDCGGCDLQDLPYASQLELKQTRIKKLFAAWPQAVSDIVPSPHPYGYRNRITVHRQGQKIGFHRRGTNDVVAVSHCPIADDAVNAQLAALTPKDVPNGGTLELRSDNNAAFAQANTALNETLIKTVVAIASLKKSEAVLELYAGAGNFTFALAATCRLVMAVEGSAAAVKAGESDRIRRGIKNVRFTTADVFTETARLIEAYETCDVIVCDPPREGLRDTARAITKLAAKRIVYVSCEPSALLRDAKTLETKGYALTRIVPFDMFPQTRHVELVALFTASKQRR